MEAQPITGNEAAQAIREEAAPVVAATERAAVIAANEAQVAQAESAIVEAETRAAVVAAQAETAIAAETSLQEKIENPATEEEDAKQWLSEQMTEILKPYQEALLQNQETLKATNQILLSLRKSEAPEAPAQPPTAQPQAERREAGPASNSNRRTRRRI